MYSYQSLFLPLPSALLPARKTCQARQKRVKGRTAEVVCETRVKESQKTMSTVGEDLAWA